ncbi:hypothetical protein CsatB_023595 [Cannabis sativa]
MNPVALSPPSDSLVSHCHSNGSTGTPLTSQQSFSIVSNLTAATVSRRLSLPQSQLTFILGFLVSKIYSDEVICMGVAIGNLSMEEKQVFQNV